MHTVLYSFINYAPPLTPPLERKVEKTNIIVGRGNNAGCPHATNM